MPLNRLMECRRGRVMQELRASSKPPQRHCANLVLCVRRTVLHDSIARADVVQQEVPERMKLHPHQPKGSWQSVSATVNHGTRRGSSQCFDVAGRAAYLLEDLFPFIYKSSAGNTV